MISQKKNGTSTSSFGVGARLNHNSSKFYSSKMYDTMSKIKESDNITKTEQEISQKSLNKIFCKSSESMKELPDNSVHLMVTSPPYNVGKEYDEDLNLEEYLALLEKVMIEVYRVLVHGGRACINIANIGRKPYIPLHAYIIQIMEKIGFLMRGEIIWNKSSSAGTSTAWGSWKSAKNPTLRDVHEYILVFSKNNYGRQSENKEDTITRDEFLEFGKSIWTFPAASAKKIGHPAPFPEELPRRLIQLYTFKEDIILDPFMGSGQTALAAIKSNRSYVGYDKSEEYCKLIEKRIAEVKEQKKLI